MCDPISATLAAVSLASSVTGAKSQKKAATNQAALIEQNAANNIKVADYNAKSIENVAGYNAAVAENNAALYKEAAVDALVRGGDDAAKERIKGKEATATGRAARASSGTVVDAGTNLDLYIQNAQNAEINALTTMNNAEREAYGYKIQETDELNRAAGIRYTSKVDADNIRFGAKVGANNAQYEAQNTRYAGKLNSKSTLLSGAVNAGSMFYKGGNF